MTNSHMRRASHQQIQIMKCHHPTIGSMAKLQDTELSTAADDTKDQEPSHLDHGNEKGIVILEDSLAAKRSALLHVIKQSVF